MAVQNLTVARHQQSLLCFLEAPADALTCCSILTGKLLQGCSKGVQGGVPLLGEDWGCRRRKSLAGLGCRSSQCGDVQLPGHMHCTC